MITNGKINKPKIVCVGSNIESKIALRELVREKVNIVGLVTRPSGEPGPISDYVDLHDYCNDNSIQTIDCKNINNANVLIQIKKIQPDYIFTLGWSQLFGEKLLSIPKHYVIGSHPSILPKGRGRAPVPWTILEDLKKSAVSFFKMDIGADSGDLLLQEFFDIPANSNAWKVYQLVANNLGKGFVNIYNLILKNELRSINTTDSEVSYRSKRTPSDGLINFGWSAKYIDRLIRAVSYPYPGAYSYYNDKIIKVWDCSLDEVPVFTAIPGQILEIKPEKLLVYAKESAIWLSDFTDQLGNKIEVDTFKIGSYFGYKVEDEIYNIKNELKLIRSKIFDE